MEEIDVKDLAFEERKDAILNAIRRGDYEIEIEEPNNIICRMHPDGSLFYVLRGDDIKFGVWAGSCRVTIEGIAFDCDLNYGDWSSDDAELLEDSEVLDAIESIDGVICGEHHSDDELISIYEAANKCKVEEYYGCWEDNIPPDASDIRPLNEKAWLTALEFDGETYYIDGCMINDADERHQGKRWTLGAYGEPDNWGLFRCKVVLLEGEKKSSIEEEVIFDVEDSDDTMDQMGNYSGL